MTNSLRYSGTTLRKVVATAIAHLLVIAMCAPLSAAARPLTKTRSLQQQSAAPYREHELLVRFRAGTSDIVNYY